MTDHCSCVARMQVVTSKYEVAITPVNIEHWRFIEDLGHKLLEVVCKTCDTRFYVATLTELKEAVR